MARLRGYQNTISCVVLLISKAYDDNYIVSNFIKMLLNKMLKDMNCTCSIIKLKEDFKNNLYGAIPIFPENI